jgi:hypothetical protein
MTGAEPAPTVVVAWPRRGPQLVGLFTLLLVAATWSLWWGDADFPLIPWFEFLLPTPLLVDRMLVGVLLAASAGLIVAPESARRWSLTGYLLGLSGLILLDQHRLQPWALLFWLEAVALLGLGASASRGWIRWLVISLYFWSAVSKLDYSFLNGQEGGGGPWLIVGLLRGLGMEPRMIPVSTLVRLSWLLPVGELAAAALLAIPRSRRLGLGLSLVMHVGLLLALGPRGHRHHPGVLIWNLFFVVQNAYLFFREAPAIEQTASSSGSTRGHGIAACVLMAAMVGPLLESLGCYDHWPAWAVYSNRRELVHPYIHPLKAAALVHGVQISQPEPLSDWSEVVIDGWSFDSRRCPIYPQERYRLAVIRAVGARAEVGPEMKVTIEGVPDRWTGVRPRVELPDFEAVLQRCETFWFNTRERRITGN